MRNLKIWFFFIFLFFSHFLLAFEGVATHRQGGGIGYKKHYSKIGIYHAFENHALQPFIDLRYLVLNKGKQGANLGAGLAYQFAQENRLSAYTYLDLAESRTHHLFNQATGGLSYTHPLIFSDKDWGELTCYFNGYFPLKSIEKKSNHPHLLGLKGITFLLTKQIVMH